jgi:transposase
MEKYNSKIINLPGYVITDHYSDNYRLNFYVSVGSDRDYCPRCGKKTKTVYETKVRKLRHCFWHERRCNLFLNQRRFKCQNCKHRFWEVPPGTIKYARRTENFKKQIAKTALHGHDNKRVAKDFTVGQATVQRDVNHFTKLEVKKKSSQRCPRVLGIDEHYFTKRKGFATTLCDLGKHRVYDVVLGRSDLALDPFFRRLQHKDRCKVVLMDLSSTYRSIIKKHFPNAMIVADRFHVIRLLIQRFNEVWKILDETGRKDFALISLFRRRIHHLKPEQQLKFHQYLRSKPGLVAVYDFRNEIHDLLAQRNLSKKKMRRTIKQYFRFIKELETSPFKPLHSLAQTFKDWQEEILRMLRFSKSNGITEGFHNKMEVIARRAYGFRNFNNYRQRVLLQCA